MGDFRFELATGELTPVGRPAETVRLAPQPATLLRLLIEKKGELLRRDEICRQLWPDTHVDVDQSLSFCVRQVRSALDDSADEPRYVETLPRRGYRLLAPVEEEREGEVAEGGAPKPTASRRWWWVPVALAVLLAGVLAWLPGERSSPPTPVPWVPEIRLGIMSFAPPPEMEVEVDTSRIAELVLAELGTDLDATEVGVVGPSTTAAYDGSARSLRELARDYELDYILNGRFLETPEGPSMLAELIRVEDGVHVWVKRFNALADFEGIAEEITGAVESRLGESGGSEG